MKAYCITLIDNHISETGRDILRQSSDLVGNDLDISTYPAITPTDVDYILKLYNLEWTWPWKDTKEFIDIGIVAKAYKTAEPYKRIACAMSHFLLWARCIETGEPILILEHDALFTKKLEVQKLLNSEYQVIGINDPTGATRLAHRFDYEVKKAVPDEFGCVPCPIIDDMNMPQGIAGNSAYLIKPRAARKMWINIYKYGCWPNDAIMCQQLLPEMGVTKEYYTRVQGLPSTTSL